MPARGSDASGPQFVQHGGKVGGPFVRSSRHGSPAGLSCPARYLRPPRKPPSFTQRFFAAASAALVRCEYVLVLLIVYSRGQG